MGCNIAATLTRLSSAQPEDPIAGVLQQGDRSARRCASCDELASFLTDLIGPSFTGVLVMFSSRRAELGEKYAMMRQVVGW